MHTDVNEQSSESVDPDKDQDCHHPAEDHVNRITAIMKRIDHQNDVGCQAHDGEQHRRVKYMAMRDAASVYISGTVAEAILNYCQPAMLKTRPQPESLRSFRNSSTPLLSER